MRGKMGHLLTEPLRPIKCISSSLFHQVSGILCILLGSNSASGPVPTQVERGAGGAKYLAHSSLALEAAVSWKSEPLCLKKGVYLSVSGPG